MTSGVNFFLQSSCNFQVGNQMQCFVGVVTAEEDFLLSVAILFHWQRLCRTHIKRYRDFSSQTPKRWCLSLRF